MAELRSAAGLEPSILPAGAYPMDSCGEGKSGKLISPPSSPGEVANVKAHCEGLQAEENACSGMPSGGRDGYTAEVVIDRPTVEGQYHTHSRVPAVANNCGKTATEAKGHSAVPSSSASEKAVNSEVRDRNAVAKVSSVWADAISTDKGLDQQEKTLSLSRTSLDVMNALTSGKPKADTKGKGVGEEHVKRGMRSRMMSSVGRLRRERARQRAEIHGVFPMAAEWGGLTLAALLKHGLLERKSKICAISEEATASAVLRKTLEVSSGYPVSEPLGRRCPGMDRRKFQKQSAPYCGVQLHAKCWSSVYSSTPPIGELSPLCSTISFSASEL